MNALLALFLPNDLWPPVLKDAGFRLAGLEVPVTTSEGSTTVDCVAAHDETNVLLVAECKSGANVDRRQARKLALLDPEGLVRTASVTVTTAAAPVVQVVYVCLLRHVRRIMHGLQEAGVEAPVLAVDPTGVEHRGPGFGRPTLDGAFSERLHVPGSPPQIVRFDGQSTVQEFTPAVLAELVAAQSHRRAILTVRALTEAVVPQYAFYGRRSQQTLLGRVEEAVRQLARDQPDTFRLRPRTEGQIESAVEILQSPETLDSRGRTQAYQAIGRRSSRRREPKPPPEGQLQLDLVMRELEQLTDPGDEEE